MAEELYQRVVKHLTDISTSPSSTPPDTRLLDDATVVLPEYLSSKDPALWAQRLTLMRTLAAGLAEPSPRDRSSEVELLVALFAGWSWPQVYDFGTGNVPFTDGLQVGPRGGGGEGEDDPMRPFNHLMLALLEKATGSAADAAHVAALRETVQALVRLWLGTGDAGVAMRAGRLLLDLLRVDQVRTPWESGERRLPSSGGGQGMVWKRLFEDRDVYAVLFESCSLRFAGDGLSVKQKTLAQARLMEWLPKVAEMDWAVVARSHHRDVEARAGVKENGLLEFATLQMVDFQDDVLMHRCLVDFYADLLACTSPLVATGQLPGSTSATTLNASPALHYYIAHGVHARTIAIYLQDTEVDPMATMFVYGPAANYIAVYASRYPEHFLVSQLPKQLNHRFATVFDLSPGKWAHAESPKHDLHLLASLPRKAILPTNDGGFNWGPSPLLLLPSKSTNPDVLHTLATIFHPEKTVRFPPSLVHGDKDDLNEAAAARTLYFDYLAHNKQFWADIIRHADTVALKDLALAALFCLHAVITADWSSHPSDPLPTSIPTPETGAIAILSPPALEHILPYLLKPPQSFANLVGGHGDTESAAFKVAQAKFDALYALHVRLQVQVQQQPGEGYEEIVATLAKRLAAGPLSREGDVGGRVATMEL
nr:hypothetical protein CFP56_22040 [Quercus suber]